MAFVCVCVRHGVAMFVRHERMFPSLLLQVDLSIGRWAALHKCSDRTTAVSTPFDGGARNIGCVAYPDCKNGARVMVCVFDGEHGNWMEGGLTEALAGWFFLAQVPPRAPTRAVQSLGQ